MIKRNLQSTLQMRLQQMPIVALLGSRQVGKTTIARSLEIDKPTIYLDLERPSDLAKLYDPELYLEQFSGHLVIIDEVQRQPELFPVLRSITDERRRAGESSGHFLLLGSASPELLRQGSETLAGRISYLELAPFLLPELGADTDTANRHWFRGGYPNSYLATNDIDAMQWCQDFITNYVERYLPQLGASATPIQLRRLCSMVAHQQSSILNHSHIGNALGLDGKTVRTYLDMLEGLYLVRRLPAWSTNVGKRLVKASKVQWRDTGLLHGLFGFRDLEDVLGHPICGHSWESYCIEQILNSAPAGTMATYYRTHAGAEIDLVLEVPDGRIHAIEIKRTTSPKFTPAFRESMSTIGATSGIYVMPQGEGYRMSENVWSMSLPDLFVDGRLNLPT